VKRLLSHGANTDKTTFEGKSTVRRFYFGPYNLTQIVFWQALHRAAGVGDAEIVRLLLEARANPFARESNGETALHKAGENGHAEVVKLLLQKAPGLEQVTDNNGRIPRTAL